jgi:hypothetical protein
MPDETGLTPAPFGVFHDAETGVYTVRDLTPEEIAALPVIKQPPHATDETPSPD